jgi:hypothetical protein
MLVSASRENASVKTSLTMTVRALGLRSAPWNERRRRIGVAPTFCPFGTSELKTMHTDGDLLDQPVDVTVNAWNRNIIPWWLLLPQGVSGAIKVKLLRNLRADVRYTEYDGVAHESWDRAYGEPGLPNWLFSKSLDRR